MRKQPRPGRQRRAFGVVRHTVGVIEVDGATYWDSGDVAHALDVGRERLRKWWDGEMPRPALRIIPPGRGRRGGLALFWDPLVVVAWALEHPVRAKGGRRLPRPCARPGWSPAGLPPPVPSPTAAELPERLRTAASEVAAEIRSSGRWCTAADVLAVYAGTTRAGGFEEFERASLILGLLRARGLRGRREPSGS